MNNNNVTNHDDMFFGAIVNKYITISFSIICFILFFILKDNNFNDCKTESDCNKKLLTNTKEGDVCAKWKDGKCKIGKITNGKCVVSNSVVPIILLVIGIIFLLYTIVLQIMNIKKY
jgi:hypothetical protein